MSKLRSSAAVGHRGEARSGEPECQVIEHQAGAAARAAPTGRQESAALIGDNVAEGGQRVTRGAKFIASIKRQHAKGKAAGHEIAAQRLPSAGGPFCEDFHATKARAADLFPRCQSGKRPKNRGRGKTP